MPWTDLTREVLPVVLAGLGSIIALVGSGIAWAVRAFWKAHVKEIEVLAKGLEAVATQLAKVDVDAKKNFGRVAEHLQALRAELQLSTQKSEVIKGGILSLEGCIKQQQAQIQIHIERIIKLEGKLEAVFRYIDAPKRRTEAVNE